MMWQSRPAVYQFFLIVLHSYYNSKISCNKTKMLCAISVGLKSTIKASKNYIEDMCPLPRLTI